MYSTHACRTLTFTNCLHASWCVRVTAVPLYGTEASEENAPSEEKGIRGGDLEKQKTRCCNAPQFNLKPATEP